MASEGLSNDAIKALLTSQPKAKGPVTEPRTIDNFYRLNHILDLKGCSNPNCQDTRPHDDTGRHILITVLTPQGDQRICRFCFLEGYLSTSGNDGSA